MTSMRRRYVASTSLRRHVPAGNLPPPPWPPNILNLPTPMIICSNSFSHYKGDQKKTVAIFQMFNHVQLHVHWMHLLTTRKCRYTWIYIYIYIQTLHYCPAGAWRWNDVVLTSMRSIDVILTSCACWGDQDGCVKSCPTLEMKSTAFSKVYF